MLIRDWLILILSKVAFKLRKIPEVLRALLVRINSGSSKAVVMFPNLSALLTLDVTAEFKLTVTVHDYFLLLSPVASSTAQELTFLPPVRKYG